jgi:hypothetical protein
LIYPALKIEVAYGPYQVNLSEFWDAALNKIAQMAPLTLPFKKIIAKMCQKCGFIGQTEKVLMKYCQMVKLEESAPQIVKENKFQPRNSVETARKVSTFK